MKTVSANLIEKFTLEGDRLYREADFHLIAAWGFDFVRLTVDYRIWARRGEAAHREIDQVPENTGAFLSLGSTLPDRLRTGY